MHAALRRNAMNPTTRTINHRAGLLLASLLLAPALSAHAQALKNQHAGSPPAASAAAAPATVSGVINLNTASLEELTRLPGVGPSRAKAIVELRTKMNGFKSTEDIMRVRGIGRKTFRKLEPMLRLQGATTLVDARKPAAGRASGAAAR